MKASRGQNVFPQAFPTASVSVGKDDWANQVIDNVVGSPQEWIENREETLKKTILEKKRLFHKNRFLELKNLPDGVTEQDIRTAFPDIELTNITIEKSDGRYRPGAKLSLSVPELLDDWPKARENVFVKNKEVSVCVGSSDQWVCVARLPLDLSDSEFTTLVSGYGKVRSCFLMCSEKTGESKGYGLVKYCSNEAAAQARHLLDGRDIRGFSIQADWLNSTHISFKQLHSKCLYVDNLPPNYRDMTTYRKIFSVIKNPPYCQIAMRNGVIQDWGLVEFFDSEEAEKTQEELNGYNLKGHNIRVHYCIPGVNAINIYMKVVNAPSDTKKKALLEDAPSSSVYSQLQKLASQNPVFAQNLQNIIQTQIQTIQTGIPPEKRQSSSSSPTPGSDILPQSINSQQQINSNAQAALMILLTAQRQAQAGENSLLHNPEVVNVLQSLVCQANDPLKQDMDPYAEIMSIPGITVALGQPPTQHVPAAQVPYSSSTSATSWAQPAQLINSTKERQVIGSSPNPVSTSPTNPQGKSPPPIIANNLNLLSNTQSLNQLLGVISKPLQSPPPPPPPSSQTKTTSAASTITQSLPNQRQSSPPLNSTQTQQRPALLGDCPRSQIQLTANLQQHQLAQQASVQQLLQAGQQQQLLQAQMTAVGQMQAANHLQLTQQLAGIYPQYQQLQQAQFLIPGIPGLPMTGPPQAGFFIQPSQQFGANPSIVSALSLPPTQGLISAPQAPISVPSMSTNSYQIMPPITSPVRSPVPRISSPASSISSSASYTPSPSNLKRKASIPASPESSPQGPYIGQHSQGLGGHYADSYWQKKRLKQNY